MRISKNAEALRAYRQGDLARAEALLGSRISGLGCVCSICGGKLVSSDPAVMADDALGWQIAHPHCVGVSVEPIAATSPEPIEIDYGKGKAPYRAALVAEIKAQDKAIGVPGSTLRALARAQIQRGIDSDQTSLREIADRLDGKPQQSVEMGVKVSLEQLIMQSIKLEQPEASGGNSGGNLPERSDTITIESDT